MAAHLTSTSLNIIPQMLAPYGDLECSLACKNQGNIADVIERIKTSVGATGMLKGAPTNSIASACCWNT
jgi:hypothetical protein